MNYLLSLAENEYVEYICLMMVVARSGNLIPSAFKDFVERKVKNKTLLLNISNLLKSSNDGNDFLNAYAKFVSKQSGGLLSDLIGLYFIRLTIRHLSKVFFAIKFNMTAKSIKNYILNNVINFIKSTPILSSIISSKFSSMEKDIEKELKSPLGDPETRERFIELPQNGLSDNEILSKMQDYHAKEAPRWKDGFVSGAVYNGEEKMLNLQVEAYKLYSVSNPLHADLWPSVMKFEAEIIAMTANLVNGGDKNVCGAMTSGGTESILMAAKTHREWFLREHGITQPEIIAPQTAHAAIDKACEILGIKLIHAPVDPVTRMVIVSEIRARITKDTIMIYSSAPQFPHGIIDPIDKLSEIAYSYGIGLHVDCCLGGFILPFGRKLQKLGMGDYGIPAFDFELRGVTSMSVDTHKYAYAPKGTSVVLYRSKNIRKYQYFAFPKWPGGLYVTPATPGSRPGGLSAGCWASMLSMGETGYLNATKSILDTVQDICKGLQTIEGVQIIGKPCAMIVAIASERFNIYDLNHKLHKRGWVLNSLQNPACIHLCVTLRTVPVKEKFVNDVRESAIELLASGSTKAEGGSAPIYGMASVLPEGPIEDMLRVYTDVTLKP